jgi:hypothetical protein
MVPAGSGQRPAVHHAAHRLRVLETLRDAAVPLYSFKFSVLSDGRPPDPPCTAGWPIMISTGQPWLGRRLLFFGILFRGRKWRQPWWGAAGIGGISWLRVFAIVIAMDALTGILALAVLKPMRRACIASKARSGKRYKKAATP